MRCLASILVYALFCLPDSPPRLSSLRLAVEKQTLRRRDLRGFNPDLPAVGVDNASRNGQTHPSSGRLSIADSHSRLDGAKEIFRIRESRTHSFPAPYSTLMVNRFRLAGRRRSAIESLPELGWLAIARGIVDAHGGKIWIEAAEGHAGAKFVFQLPIAIRKPGRESGRQQKSVNKNGSQERILVWDDEPSSHVSCAGRCLRMDTTCALPATEILHCRRFATGPPRS